MKSDAGSFKIRRPVRASLLSFLALALLLGIAAPFYAVDLWSCAVLSIGYSALLTFVGVGFGLLQSDLRSSLLAYLIPIPPLVVGVCGALFFLTQVPSPRTLLTIIEWTSISLLVLMICLATFGWYHHFSSARQSS